MRNKIIALTEKKVNNNKIRNECSIKLINKKRNTIFFVQADSNILWLPRIIRLDNDNSTGISFGWLFVQFGKLTVKFIEEKNNEKNNMYIPKKKKNINHIGTIDMNELMLNRQGKVNAGSNPEIRAKVNKSKKDYSRKGRILY